MSERLQARHEFDAAIRGEGIQREHRLCVQRARIRTDLRVSSEIKGVLDVEHQHIETQTRTDFDQVFECLAGWHLAARHVEHQAPITKIRLVQNLQHGNAASGHRELQQGLESMAETVGAGSRDLDPLLADSQSIGVASGVVPCSKRGVLVQSTVDAGHAQPGRTAPFDAQRESVALEDGVACLASGNPEPTLEGLGGDGQRDRHPLAEPKQAASAPQAFR